MNATQQGQTGITFQGMEIYTKPRQKKIIENGKKTTYEELLKGLKGTGKLWEDPEFLAVYDTVYYNKGHSDYEWKRPKDILKNAVLSVDGISRFNVNHRGTTFIEMDNFYSALAIFAEYKPLFKNVVPDGQDFGENYIGAFRFRFWRFGEWREVIVDDRLPIDKDGLIYSQTSSKNEFWAALAEKAYAKLHGTYEALMLVSQDEGLVDLTGGLCETLRLFDNERPKDLYTQMLKAYSLSSLMCCETKSIPDDKTHGIGLASQRRYSITAVVEINLNDGKTERLIRLRNPWDNNFEWKLKWGDNSDMWDLVSSSDKAKYYLGKTDGEFWMSFDDFVINFKDFMVCHLCPESKDPSDDNKHWKMAICDGSWIRNVNAGGTRMNLDLYTMNPQYRINVLDPDKDDQNKNVTLMVSLSQKNLLGFYPISYEIYKVNDSKVGRRDKTFFKSNKPISETTKYMSKRDISCRHIVTVGQYLIVPSTYGANQEGQFILRIGAEKLIDFKEIDEESDIIDIDENVNVRIADMTFDNLEKELKIIFEKISDNNGVIDVIKFQKILNVILKKDSQCVKMKDFDGFSMEVCKSMIALYDYNHNGKMELNEFLTLFKKLRIWKTVYKNYDKEDDGFFPASDFRRSLAQCGFRLSNALHKVTVLKYEDPSYCHITFTGFVMALIRLTNSYERFKKKVEDYENGTSNNRKDYVNRMIYA